MNGLRTTALLVSVMFTSTSRSQTWERVTGADELASRFSVTTQ